MRLLCKFLCVVPLSEQAANVFNVSGLSDICINLSRKYDSLRVYKKDSDLR
jgi:hypothetical protein